MATRTRYVQCPTCGKQVKWGPEAKWRPFCSERCRIIDLGDWASEKHRLPSDERPSDDDESN